MLILFSIYISMLCLYIIDVGIHKSNFIDSKTGLYPLDKICW